MIFRFRQHDIRAKTRSRMTAATTFSRQNDAGSRAYTTQYWENLVLVVVLVLESKALYWDKDDYEGEILSILSSARAWTSVNLAGKRDRRHNSSAGLNR